MDCIWTPLNIMLFNTFRVMKLSISKSVLRFENLLCKLFQILKYKLFSSNIIIWNVSKIFYFALSSCTFAIRRIAAYKVFSEKINTKKKLSILRIFILIAFIIVLLVKIFIISFPVKYEKEIEKYSEMYNIDKSLVFAIINTESHFKENSVSNKGASGLMQIMEPTADWAAQQMGLKNYSYERIFEPELNIEMGCWILSRLWEKYDGDTVLICAAYNAGMGNVSKWLSEGEYSEDGKTLLEIPFKETKNYVVKVALNYKIYEIILQ